MTAYDGQPADLSDWPNVKNADLFPDFGWWAESHGVADSLSVDDLMGLLLWLAPTPELRTELAGRVGIAPWGYSSKSDWLQCMLELAFLGREGREAFLPAAIERCAELVDPERIRVRREAGLQSVIAAAAAAGAAMRAMGPPPDLLGRAKAAVGRAKATVEEKALGD